MQQEVVVSGPATADDVGDIVFDFTTEMTSLLRDETLDTATRLIQHECPVLVYITSRPSENLVGATTSSCLVAAAVIDFRFALFFQPTT